ncbi:hypothetical protein ZIOFF_024753 [Zingiber officinale]|uniref:Uncharacterized protein n=1 Tax=Zingiber officinale TaxID=94328 RepID=A0A8J5HD18_ZINOF|nr:hypothetical protein ZIOFF_024753 [Zingiber officinale]
MASKKGLEDFDAVFGEATPECDAETSPLAAAAARPFLFYAHYPDPSCLEVVATDFHSHTFSRLFTAHDLEDLRDDIGIGGSWSEFIDYLNSSLSYGNVKLILGSSHNRDSGELSYLSQLLLCINSKLWCDISLHKSIVNL